MTNAISTRCNRPCQR